MSRAAVARAGFVTLFLAPAAWACGPEADGTPGELAGEAPVPAREGRIEAPDGPLAWLRLGEGPATLVVHGGPGLDHRYLHRGLRPLARDRSLVFHDLRGLGGSVPDSGPPDSLALSWDRVLEDLDALADRFAAADGRVAVLAHSWGALPALAWALTRPGRVRALVLVAPVEPGTRFAAETRERQAGLTDSVRRGVLDSLLALAAERRAEPSFRSEVFRASFRVTAPRAEVVDGLDLSLSETTARNGDLVARRVMGTGGGALDLWDDLAALDAPVLVIHGADDVAPPAMARALADSLPGGQWVILEEVGHFPFAGAPEAFVTAVDAFLRRSEGR